jgi:hypothetical protein
MMTAGRTIAFRTVVYGSICSNYANTESLESADLAQWRPRRRLRR